PCSRSDGFGMRCLYYRQSCLDYRQTASERFRLAPRDGASGLRACGGALLAPVLQSGGFHPEIALADVARQVTVSPHARQPRCPGEAATRVHVGDRPQRRWKFRLTDNGAAPDAERATAEA